MEDLVSNLVIMDVTVPKKRSTGGQSLQRENRVPRAEPWENPYFSGKRRERSQQLDVEEEERKEENLGM